MDINELLKGFECNCGKFHSCNIDCVYIEKGAISRLKDICDRYENALIVADENTYEAAGEKTVTALALSPRFNGALFLW